MNKTVIFAHESCAKSSNKIPRPPSAAHSIPARAAESPIQGLRQFFPAAEYSLRCLRQMGPDANSMCEMIASTLGFMMQSNRLPDVDRGVAKYKDLNLHVAYCSHVLKQDFKVKWALPLQLVQLVRWREVP